MIDKKPKNIKLRDYVEVVPREDHPHSLRMLYGKKLTVMQVVWCDCNDEWLYEVARIPGLVSERTIKKWEPRHRSKFIY